MRTWLCSARGEDQTIFDVMFNIGFLLIIIGGITFMVSFVSCIGALRENMFLLKFYSLFLLIFFLAEMTLLALSFIYPHKLTDFLEEVEEEEEELSEKLIQSYQDDLDLIDLVQHDFQCCDISSEGFRDWSKIEYFNWDFEMGRGGEERGESEWRMIKEGRGDLESHREEVEPEPELVGRDSSNVGVGWFYLSVYTKINWGIGEKKGFLGVGVTNGN